MRLNYSSLFSAVLGVGIENTGPSLRRHPQTVNLYQKVRGSWVKHRPAREQPLQCDAFRAGIAHRTGFVYELVQLPVGMTEGSLAGAPSRRASSVFPYGQIVVVERPCDGKVESESGAGVRMRAPAGVLRAERNKPAEIKVLHVYARLVWRVGVRIHTPLRTG